MVRLGHFVLWDDCAEMGQMTKAKALHAETTAGQEKDEDVCRHGL
jgi:hypothetical protein